MSKTLLILTVQQKISEKFAGRIDKMADIEAYITIKDDNYFLNKISCPWINPSKSSIGKISDAGKKWFWIKSTT